MAARNTPSAQMTKQQLLEMDEMEEIKKRRAMALVALRAYSNGPTMTPGAAIP